MLVADVDDSSHSSPGEAARLASIDELAGRFSEQEASAITSLHRSRLTGHYLAPGMEDAYREWHAVLLRPRLIVIFGCVGAGFSVASLLVLQTQHSYKALIVEAHPEAELSIIVSTVLARLSPFVSVLLLLLPWTRCMLTGRTYQYWVLVNMICPVLIDVGALIVITAGDETQVLLPSAQEAISSALVNRSACSALTMTTDPVHAVRSAYWHAINADFLLAIAGGLSGLRPLHSFVLGLMIAPILHLQLQGLWRFTEMQRGPLEWKGTEWVPVYELGQVVPIYFRLLPVITMVFISGMQERAHREEFRYRQLLQAAKNTRIEQLEREKDRLAWDRKLREERVRSAHTRNAAAARAGRTSDEHAPRLATDVTVDVDGARPDVGEGSSAAGSRALAGGAQPVSGTSYAWRAPPSEPSSAVTCSELGAIMRSAGVGTRRSSEPSSTVTCSELGAIMCSAGVSMPEDEGSGARGGRGGRRLPNVN